MSSLSLVGLIKESTQIMTQKRPITSRFPLILILSFLNLRIESLNQAQSDN